MSDRQSESPRERVNITYVAKTDGLSEEIEIPYKMMVLGKFNPNKDKKALIERKPININKVNFDKVIQKQNIKMEFTVKDRLSGDENSELNINLNIRKMKDFSPDNIVENVEELKKLMELREYLLALKAPLGNIPAFRKAIEGVIDDEEKSSRLLNEIGI